MSALIEKIRQETRVGNFAKLKRILSTNLRHFASLTKAEQNVLLLALINLQDSKKLFRYLGAELDESTIIKAGQEEFKRQLIMALSYMWFGSEEIAFRIASRLNDILISKKIVFCTADQKRIVENLSSIYHAQAKFDQVIKLLKIFPRSTIPETQHLDAYFFRKYYTAFFNTKQPSKTIINKVKKIRAQTDNPIVKLFLFFDICTMLKSCGEITSSDIVRLIKKEKILELAAEKRIQTSWLQMEFALAEIEKENYPKGKKLLKEALYHCKLPSEAALILAVLHYHFPKSLNLGQILYYLSYHVENISTFSSQSQDCYLSKIRHYMKQGDCWYITKSKIISCKYSDLKPSNNFIDLAGGIVTIRNRTFVLTEKRIRFLTRLISRGHIGSADIELITKIYPEILAHHAHNKRDALKNLSHQFNKCGIKTIKSKAFYFYNFDKNDFDIILPMSLEPIGLNAYCEKNLSFFNSNDLMKLLQIKRTTAFELIKEWKASKLIKPLPSKNFTFILPKQKSIK